MRTGVENHGGNLAGQRDEPGTIQQSVQDHVRRVDARREKGGVVRGRGAADEKPDRVLHIDAIALLVIEDVVEEGPVWILQLRRERAGAEIHQRLVVRAVENFREIIDAPREIHAVRHEIAGGHIADGAFDVAVGCAIRRDETRGVPDLRRQRRQYTDARGAVVDLHDGVGAVGEQRQRRAVGHRVAAALRDDAVGSDVGCRHVGEQQGIIRLAGQQSAVLEPRERDRAVAVRAGDGRLKRGILSCADGDVDWRRGGDERKDAQHGAAFDERSHRSAAKAVAQAHAVLSGVERGDAGEEETIVGLARD